MLVDDALLEELLLLEAPLFVPDWFVVPG